MRKIRLLGILCMCALVICSCSGNGKLPIERKNNAKNDRIKFYGFEWLTEKKEIDSKFSKDFGEFVSATGLPDGAEHLSVIDEKLSLNDYFYYKDEDENSLLWEIAGNEIDFIAINYITPDNGKNNYLVSAQYYFKYPSEELYNALATKLSDKYGEKKEGPFDDSWYTYFNDENENEIVIHYFESTSGTKTKHLVITYNCVEVLDILWDRETEYEKRKTESSDGL